MTKREYRNYSRLFFFFSLIFSGFLINAIAAGFSLKSLISSLMFGVLIITQLRVALLMYRKSLEMDLK